MNRSRLIEINNEYKKIIESRIKNNGKREILVCGGTGCLSNKSVEIAELLRYEIKKQNLNIDVLMIGCLGLCANGTVIIVKPDNVFYNAAKLSDIDEIVDSHLIHNVKVERLLYHDKEKVISKLEDIPFYKKQKRIVLKYAGFIDPENIFEYIGVNGYLALSKCLFEISRDEILEEVKKSKLRGRGGAGFPTGQKWEFIYKAIDKEKYVVCNADEGDPGAFMDRSIIEASPHSIIEAMTILGYLIGSKKGFIYVRHEYPIARKRLERAISDAKRNNLLGKNILETNFSFDIEIRLGAGAFVCGEETALINSIMGLRGEPRIRPPYPTDKGVFNHPTVINNVETFANIPNIILNGGEEFSKIGTENSTGTKVFALGGCVNNTGLVEVAMGTTLKEIIYDIGGGIKNNHKFKFAQTGGPSGGCIPEKYLDIPMDYEHLKEIGTMMGSGGLIIMDNTSCPVDISKFFLSFSCFESCGKCTPCRLGNQKIYNLLDKISKGKALKEDLDELEELCYYVKDNSLCGLGQASPNPVLSTLKYFHDEYLLHLEGKCPSGSCKELSSYRIIKEKCIGCGLCKLNCPVKAISGEHKMPHKIDTSICIKCGKCFNNCPVKAIIKE